MYALTKQEFLRRFFAAHGHRYTIDPDTVYTKVHQKYFVVCPEHGEWEAWGHHLLNGVGCPACHKEKREAQFWATVKAKGWDVHYDVTGVEFKKTRDLIFPVCNTHHKVVRVTARSFELGTGCRYCHHFAKK